MTETANLPIPHQSTQSNIPDEWAHYLDDWEPPKIQEMDHMAWSHFNICQMKYFLRLVIGYVPAKRSEALSFGIAMHAGREWYKRAIKNNAPHEDAMEIAIGKFIEAWNKELPVEMKDVDKLDDRRGVKNGVRLLRGYLDKYKHPFLTPLHIETPFAVELGVTPSGVTVVHTGIVDDVSKWQNFNLVGEFKTSSYFPNAKQMEPFRVSEAVFMYISSAKEVIQEEIHGALCHKMWTQTEPKTKRPTNKPFDEYFAGITVIPTIDQLNEAKLNFIYKIEELHTAHKRKYFTMAMGDACNLYGGCPYREMCKSPRQSRDVIASQQYVRETWDPLAEERAKRVEDE